MHTVLRRLGSAISPVALVIALLALVVSAAGVGYAAGQIGGNQIKNNAITAKKIKKNAVTTKKIKNDAVTADKIKDGSLSAAELVPNEVEHLATLANGGEGDCIWSSAATLVPGIGAPTFRKDRFGTVHLAGVATVADGPGGDASCDQGDPGQSADAIVFMLPAGYVPAKTLVFGDLNGGALIVVGPVPLVDDTLVLPPGAVAAGTTAGGALLDGVTYEPAGSGVLIPKVSAAGRFKGSLAQTLGLS